MVRHLPMVVAHRGELLGSTFGLELQVTDVDDFLMSKIKKKITYSESRHLSLA